MKDYLVTPRTSLPGERLFEEVIPTRFERVTHSLEGCCSIQLSYGTIINFWTANIHEIIQK